MRSLFVILILAIAASGCNKNCRCPEEGINFGFVSYADSEIDTIIITRYQKGRNFSDPVDSFALNAAVSTRSRSGDTTFITVQTVFHRLADRYDVRVFNPFDGSTTLISDIELDVQPADCGNMFGRDPEQCTSPITGFRKNGVPTTLEQSGSFRALLIKK